MKQAHGWYWPDGEQHMLEWVTKNADLWEGRLAYQGKKIRRALALVPEDRRNTYIDIGGHVGLWSFYMASRFAKVYAFEPIDEHRACFRRNVDMKVAVLLSCALGDENGGVSFRIDPKSTGGTYINGKGEIPVARLDDVFAGLPENGPHKVDLIKADCEGYEYFTLHGGEQLITKHRPAIVVEQKPGMAQKFGLDEQGAVDYLLSLGYKVVDEISGDFFLVPR